MIWIWGQKENGEGEAVEGYEVDALVGGLSCILGLRCCCGDDDDCGGDDEEKQIW